MTGLNCTTNRCPLEGYFGTVTEIGGGWRNYGHCACTPAPAGAAVFETMMIGVRLKTIETIHFYPAPDYLPNSKIPASHISGAA